MSEKHACPAPARVNLRPLLYTHAHSADPFSKLRHSKENVSYYMHIHNVAFIQTGLWKRKLRPVTWGHPNQVGVGHVCDVQETMVRVAGVG